MRTYTAQEVEVITRRALFQGELFGRNKERKEMGLNAQLPEGETFVEVANNFLEREGIPNSLK